MSAVSCTHVVVEDDFVDLDAHLDLVDVVSINLVEDDADRLWPTH